MSVTDPDLSFYKGPDDTPLTPDGKRKEVSIYSKSWYKTPAEPTIVGLIIKGRWRTAHKDGRMQATLLSNGTTQLSVPCEYGLASKMKLIRIDK